MADLKMKNVINIHFLRNYTHLVKYELINYIHKPIIISNSNSNHTLSSHE